MGLLDLIKASNPEAMCDAATDTLRCTINAVFGAVYIDGGMEAVNEILRQYDDYLNLAGSAHTRE